MRSRLCTYRDPVFIVPSVTVPLIKNVIVFLFEKSCIWWPLSGRFSRRKFKPGRYIVIDKQSSKSNDRDMRLHTCAFFGEYSCSHSNRQIEII